MPDNPGNQAGPLRHPFPNRFQGKASGRQKEKQIRSQSPHPCPGKPGPNPKQIPITNERNDSNLKFQILDFTCLPQAGIFQSAICNLQSAICYSIVIASPLYKESIYC